MWWKSLAGLARSRRGQDDPLQQAQEVPDAAPALTKTGLESGTAIHLVHAGLGPEGDDLLPALAGALARTFHVSVHIEDEWLDIGFAFDARRNQYYSTAILERVAQRGATWRILAVTPLDLFVPVLTFVFGEAQLKGKCAVVSWFRYADEQTMGRLIKEATHELGHTYGLRHCRDWECVMSSSASVERLDVKSADFCSRCLEAIRVEAEIPPGP
jgi:archaemetzincin